jgi:hypothetical protein
MISITVSPEQLAGAPPEVRRWLEAEVTSTLAFAEGQHRPATAPAAALAACSSEEVAQIFELVREDYFAASLFCELGRDTGIGRSGGPYHAIGIGDLLRRTRLGSGEQLMGRIETINAALRRLRGDPAATMFGFDQLGRLYIHGETHRNIAALWDELLAGQVAHPADQVTSDGGPPPTKPSGNPAPGETTRDAALAEMMGTPL